MFVGRKCEKKKIIEALKTGKNIILGGKYGIGRTTLIQEIARILVEERTFVFVDFSRTPGKMSEILFRELGLASRQNPRKKTGYKPMRYRIGSATWPGKHKPVIVLDNLAKLTVPKAIFLDYLESEQHFQFIAIVENFIERKDVQKLKALLIPSISLTLRRLNKKDIEHALQRYADSHHLDWTRSHIQTLTTLSNGYPLGLAELLKSKRLGGKT